MLRNMHQLFPLPFLSGMAMATEYHVSLAGDDTATGSPAAPFRTIQHAAEAAQPGDVITVHAGIYRERIDPPRGGLADDQRITYRAAPGEVVEIRGSEVVTGWVRDHGEVWTVAVPNTWFGTFNPFADVIHGDWFKPEGRIHHTGAVYLDGRWLGEAASRETLTQEDPGGAWWAEVGPASTVIHGHFPGTDPNRHLTEINVRQTVFYPSQPGRNWITVRGFALRHAATPWAPPTAEQIGLIGTHWSRGWIIEDNTVTHALCSGITLGKHGDRFDNTSADAAEGYVATIHRAEAHAIPWDREHIGGHLVRRNTVAFCEQAGICGSLGAIFSTIEDNEVHDVHVRRRFDGAEQGAIKIHAAIDTVIRRNHLHHSIRGLWLDWMTQGTQVVGNVFHDNREQDLFLEMNHGPFLVADNLLLSKLALTDWSEGGAFIHNLFAGHLSVQIDDRQTPWHAPHDTARAGLAALTGGDHRYHNNLFLGTGTPDPTPESGAKPPWTGWHFQGLAGYGPATLHTGGNVYLAQARPATGETTPLVIPGPGLRIRIEGRTLHFDLGAEVLSARTTPVTSELLGSTLVSRLGFTHPDGTPLVWDRDLAGQPRNATRPTAGPWELSAAGEVVVHITAGAPQQP